MGVGASFDFSDLLKLAVDVGNAPVKRAENLIPALTVTGHKVRDDWREPLSGSEYLPGGAASVTYEVKTGASLLGSAVSVEIGPELKGQGPLVGMLEYGTPNTGARGYGAAALKRNEADFELGIQKAGDVL